jgi:hypothetical protein
MAVKVFCVPDMELLVLYALAVSTVTKKQQQLWNRKQNVGDQDEMQSVNECCDGCANVTPDRLYCLMAACLPKSPH